MGALAAAVISRSARSAPPSASRALPPVFWFLLVVIVVAYLTMVEMAKRIYDRHEDRRLAAAAAIHRPALAARAPAR